MSQCETAKRVLPRDDTSFRIPTKILEPLLRCTSLIPFYPNYQTIHDSLNISVADSECFRRRLRTIDLLSFSTHLEAHSFPALTYNPIKVNTDAPQVKLRRNEVFFSVVLIYKTVYKTLNARYAPVAAFMVPVISISQYPIAWQLHIRTRAHARHVGSQNSSYEERCILHAVLVCGFCALETRVAICGHRLFVRGVGI